MEEIKHRVCKKFEILVLVDLGGLLFCRTKTSFQDCAVEPDFNIKHYWTTQDYFYKFYLRPGFKQLLELQKHPRAKLSFYTAMKHYNIVPILPNILEKADLLEELEAAEIFPASYCIKSKETTTKQNTKEWHDYQKDLDKVAKSEYCRTNNFDQSNILLIDSKLSRVQLCRQNALVCTEYTVEDVEGKTGTARDVTAQEKELNDLTEYITNLLENANSVPTYLA